MKKLVKPLTLVLSTQSVCLAIGLWMQHQFAVSMMEWEASSAGEATSTLLLRHETSWFVYPISFLWIIAMQAVAAYFVIARINSQHQVEQLKRRQESLFQSRELIRTRDAVIFGLAKLADSRDPETGMHLERIAIYSTRLASAMRHDHYFREQISSQFVKLIGISSALHDIGKVGIADSVLKKPGPLSPQERIEMEQHATIGGDCIETISKRLGKSSFLQMAKDIAYAHHERWDGTGYPNKISGKDIPLAARIVAIADVYDALSSKRVYKEALPHDQCVEIINNMAGGHFDPNIVDIFLKIEQQFQMIRDQHNLLEKAHVVESSKDLQTKHTPVESPVLATT